LDEHLLAARISHPTDRLANAVRNFAQAVAQRGEKCRSALF
jgi:hypothetical protein